MSWPVSMLQPLHTYYYMTKKMLVADWNCMWLCGRVVSVNVHKADFKEINKKDNLQTFHPCLIVFNFRETLCVFGEKPKQKQVKTRGFSKFVKSYSTWHHRVRTWPLHSHFHTHDHKARCHCAGQKTPVANNHLESFSQFSAAISVSNSNSVRHIVHEWL